MEVSPKDEQEPSVAPSRSGNLDAGHERALPLKPSTSSSQSTGQHLDVDGTVPMASISV